MSAGNFVSGTESEHSQTMSRHASFIGTLKKLFKTSKPVDDDSTRAVVTPGVTPPLRTPPRHAASDLNTCSTDSQIILPREGSILRNAPSTRKAFGRPLFAHSTGPAMKAGSPQTPGAIQAGLAHSISDPCDESIRCPGQGDKACANGEQVKPCRGSSLVTRMLKASSRNEPSLPPLRGHPIKCWSEGEHCAKAISAPVVALTPSPPAISSPLHAVEAASVSSRTEDSCGSCTPRAEPSSQPTTPPATLLSMCPGVPAGMRRKHWCLEDYEVSRKIYSGATSSVYKATCRRSGLPVALKVYYLSRVPANVIHMLVREIKIHSELMHKNIIMLYAAFQDEKRVVLVQEYAARGDLYGIHHALERRMTETQLTALVLAPFVDALTYLHSRGICHRDIKPENILFTHDWRLVVADFGVSIDLNQERAVTRAGTLEYMAPEVERCPLKLMPQDNKDKDALAYTTAVDVWATGVLAYELLVGFPPFVADTAVISADAGAAQGPGGAFLAEHCTRKTLSFPASTSEAARDFISKALAERSEERPTAVQLSRHSWIAPPIPFHTSSASTSTGQQPSSLRSSGQLTSPSGTPLTPSRLGSMSLARTASNGAPSPQQPVATSCY